jgi:hypothetical protein
MSQAKHLKPPPSMFKRADLTWSLWNLQQTDCQPPRLLGIVKSVVLQYFYDTVLRGLGGHR